MKFTLTIECDNAAFEPEDDGTISTVELGRILKGLGWSLYEAEETGDHPPLKLGYQRFVSDSNGNRVGKWEITAD